MLAKRIITCLDVKENKVVKGIKFSNHKIIKDDILSLATRYSEEGADEIVFYDIAASSEESVVNKKWISLIASKINIPFCVAGGIKSLNIAKNILLYGADKISINSPALDNPNLINILSKKFGKQCVVVGIDSWYDKKLKEYFVFKYTGNENRIRRTQWKTINWVKEVQERGAGEIVLNTMNQDGVCSGYDLVQLKKIRKICKVPLIASGGAGNMEHFYDVFKIVNVDGAIAASVFHKRKLNIFDLKKFLSKKNLEIRLC